MVTSLYLFNRWFLASFGSWVEASKGQNDKTALFWVDLVFFACFCLVAHYLALERGCMFPTCQKSQSKYLALFLREFGRARTHRREWPLASTCQFKERVPLQVTQWAGRLVFKFVFLLFDFGTFDKKNVPSGN